MRRRYGEKENTAGESASLLLDVVNGREGRGMRAVLSRDNGLPDLERGGARARRQSQGAALVDAFHENRTGFTSSLSGAQ